jgi:glutathione synthase/RimK-type ligase-like ATP-grasp enzyme/Tfp pilus assembly protein PilF
MRVTAVPFSDVSQLRAIERMIEERPDELKLRFARACALDDLGRPDDAAYAYADVLERDAQHFGALCNLGSLAFERGDLIRAWRCFQRAHAIDGNDVIANVNLGLLYTEQGAFDLARMHFDVILTHRPGDLHATLHANNGLAAIAEREGDTARAAEHRRRAFAVPMAWGFPYLGSGEPVRVLILTAAQGGDVISSGFFDDRVVQRTVMMPESYTDGVLLPPHDVIFNGIGEPDRTGATLERAAALVAASGAPAINHPAAVARTTRDRIMRALTGIDGAIVPSTLRYRRAELTPERLASDGFVFPVLVRAPGFQAGVHFERAETPDDLARALAQTPGDELYAIAYVDARAADGWVRKYRVVFVAGELYPIHLALARQWKIHYFSAAMTDHAEHRAEERRFLEAMPEVLGERAMRALHAIARRLDLDYGGVDFGIAADGRLIVFEANATMAIALPGDDPRWNYRRAPIERAIHAVRDMIVRRAVRAVS